MADVITSGFRIGRQTSPYNEFFDGQIDDIRLYNRALSADEVSDLYELDKPAEPEEFPSITRTHTVNQAGAAQALELAIITSISPSLGNVVNQFNMSFQSSKSESYSIEASVDFKTWIPLETGITGTGNRIERSFATVGALQLFGFFRVRQE